MEKKQTAEVKRTEETKRFEEAKRSAEAKRTAEAERMAALVRLETGLRQEGYRLVAGVDEAGRGPLAGPVFAAACILPAVFDLEYLNDSKKLSEKKRNTLDSKIKEQALAYCVASASPREIDLLNIAQATKIAMRRALQGLSSIPDYVLVDGREKLNISMPLQTIAGGDGLCACIAAASVLAKVARDQLMLSMHLLFPQYGFDRHKGYGTDRHLEAIKKYGPCPIHRMSFSPMKEALAGTNILV